MNKAVRFSPGIPLVVSVIIALGILLSLGTWQASKVAVKTDRIARLNAGLKAAATVLPGHVDTAQALEYRRVTFTGTVSDQKPLRLHGTNLKGRPGYFLYVPVKAQFGPSVLVNFGWIPLHHSDPVSLPHGMQAFSGVIRTTAVAGSWSPPDDIVRGIWYTADIYKMAAHFGLGSKEFYPFRIFIDHRGAANALPRGSQIRIDIPNNHFQYALTWYGLALSLIGVFVVLGLQRGREKSQST